MPLALLSALLLAAAAPRTFDVLPGSTITYHVVHRFHSVTGVSRSIEGKARLLPDGTVQVAVRAPLDSFDSGNSNRDAHMREATGAGTNPYVAFKGTGTLPPPNHFPSEQKLELRGELTLKTTRPVEVPTEVRFESADHASATCTFPVSLEEHGVERPSLMFVKVEDRVEIVARLKLGAEP
jgi:polyisoprenoid-binding protein YceI